MIASTSVGRLQSPDVEAVEVLHFALGASPLSPAKIELNANLVANLEAIKIAAAVACELKQHVLRVFSVNHFHHELSLGEALRDLLGIEYLVQLACGLNCHGRSIGGAPDIPRANRGL